jgi:hypothetical protein
MVVPSHFAAPKAVLPATGRSDGAMARGASAPGNALGEARNVFAGSDAPVKDRVPEDVTGEPPTASQFGAERLTLDTVPTAVSTPPAQVMVVPSHFAAPKAVLPAIGRSDGAMARGTSAPGNALGEARNVFAGSDAPVKDRVPEDVTGEPPTTSQFGAERPTLDTVPVPPPPRGVAQVPSPRQKVEAEAP